ncbi:hypothetical protein SAMN05880501_10834 [Ureibacillus xyleni]|uniref:Holliday junction resolvase n=1 Tax=Ureibacillus xyleni TaxID=614648 RepID=A0A285T1G5_9BACL|nr:hypothetical protein [Ureibacillus xyleni]SOC15096.1 hypothetical protein SAMN05880501_10834 [Ureibacillus xyleni]
MLIITENKLIDALEEYFTEHGFSVITKAKNRAPGIDLALFKNGVTLYIEAKGSVRNEYDTDPTIKPFTRNSVRNYVRKQITKLMEREEKGDGKNAFYIAAWPETPTYREEVNKKAKALSRLGYLHFWVQEDWSVKIEGPEADKLSQFVFKEVMQEL